MLLAFESLDWCLDLQQGSLLPGSVSQMRLHSLVALCDAFGTRVHFGLALGFASALAYALVGVAVVAALFGRSLQRFGQAIPPWIGNWTCVSTRSSCGRRRSCGRALWLLSAMLWAFESALDLRRGFASALAHALVSVAGLAVILWRSL
jgi:hypothetical protein